MPPDPRPSLPSDAAVGMIAAQILTQWFNMGRIEGWELTEYRYPGSRETYRNRTLDEAATMAWGIVLAVGRTRPDPDTTTPSVS